MTKCAPLWLLLPLLSALTLAGCGSDDQNGSALKPDEQGSDSGQQRPQPQQPEAPRLPRVAIKTTLGEIIIELDPEHAPLTVDNFLSYVDSDHYDGTIFHQVRDDIVLAGGYTDQYVEKPTSAPVRNEADNGLKNKRGTIAMARSFDAIDSATSQFFINVTDNAARLDHTGRAPEEYGFCVFGKVVKGLDVVEKISSTEVEDKVAGEQTFEETPKRVVMIETVTRVR